MEQIKIFLSTFRLHVRRHPYLKYLLAAVPLLLMLIIYSATHRERGGREGEEAVTRQLEPTLSVEEVAGGAVGVERPPKVCVDVEGAVLQPGVYCLDAGALLVDAIKSAGDFNREGYAGRYVAQTFNLATRLEDGQKIYIPFESDVACTVYKYQPLVSTQSQVSQVDEGETEEDCINLNSATVAELDSLEGVGPSTAQKIIDARPFESVEELRDVSGIGDSKYEAIKDLVCI